MRASRLFWAGLCAPAMTLTLIVGCGDKPASHRRHRKIGQHCAGTRTSGGKMSSGGGEKTPVEAAAVATIKGKVVYDGTPLRRRRAC